VQKLLQYQTKMALSKAHISAKAADVAKLLLLNNTE